MPQTRDLVLISPDHDGLDKDWPQLPEEVRMKIVRDFMEQAVLRVQRLRGEPQHFGVDKKIIYLPKK